MISWSLNRQIVFPPHNLMVDQLKGKEKKGREGKWKQQNKLKKKRRKKKNTTESRNAGQLRNTSMHSWLIRFLPWIHQFFHSHFLPNHVLHKTKDIIVKIRPIKRRRHFTQHKKIIPLQKPCNSFFCLFLQITAMNKAIEKWASLLLKV